MMGCSGTVTARGGRPLPLQPYRRSAGRVQSEWRGGVPLEVGKRSGSLPPCGGGLGWGVVFRSSNPPPQPSPARGEGADRRQCLNREAHPWRGAATCGTPGHTQVRGFRLATTLRPSYTYSFHAGGRASVAQLVELRFCKPVVAGSSPTASSAAGRSNATGLASLARDRMREGSLNGQMAERPMASDCKSDGATLRRFESCSAHLTCGRSSIGRALAFQASRCGSESRRPLYGWIRDEVLFSMQRREAPLPLREEATWGLSVLLSAVPLGIPPGTLPAK